MSCPCRPIADRFWTKVKKSGPDACWLWTASTCSAMGYGILGKGGKGAGYIMAHRFSYQFHNGAIPDGMLVCHTCDVPLCVNPKHLVLGTRLYNQGDMSRKGRSAKGERQGQAKLTERDVAAIRAMAKAHTQQCIADKYDVSRSNIYKIVNLKTWSHV